MPTLPNTPNPFPDPFASLVGDDGRPLRKGRRTVREAEPLPITGDDPTATLEAVRRHLDEGRAPIAYSMQEYATPRDLSRLHNLMETLAQAYRRAGEGQVEAARRKARMANAGHLLTAFGVGGLGLLTGANVGTLENERARAMAAAVEAEELGAEVAGRNEVAAAQLALDQAEAEEVERARVEAENVKRWRRNRETLQRVADAMVAQAQANDAAERLNADAAFAEALALAKEHRDALNAEALRRQRDASAAASYALAEQRRGGGGAEGATTGRIAVLRELDGSISRLEGQIRQAEAEAAGLPGRGEAGYQTQARPKLKELEELKEALAALQTQRRTALGRLGEREYEVYSGRPAPERVEEPVREGAPRPESPGLDGSRRSAALPEGVTDEDVEAARELLEAGAITEEEFRLLIEE